MKKLVLIFLLLSLISQLKCQNDCFSERGRSIYDIDTGCLRVLPSDIYDTALLALSYIPNENTPIITIPVNIHIWREDDGSGNWWQDTPAFRDSLQLAFDYLNLIYSHNNTYSLFIPNTQFIEDTKVRFLINDVFYYNDSFMAYQTYPETFNQYLVNNYPDRTKNFNYHLCLNRSANFAGNTFGYNWPHFTIVTVRQNNDITQNLYGLALHMAHEFGHNFGLCHTYDDEETTISDPEFLWDVFGTETQIWCNAPSTQVCYHDAGWGCDPYDVSNTCTNNIMGGTSYARHFSALQCGRIQRALLVSSLRHFAYGEENPPDLHITSNQLVDYTRKYYQTVIVDSGVTLTVTCRIEMVPSAKIIVRPGGTPRSLAQFQSDMDVASYYSAVRTLMSDTVLDLNELEQWHAAAQPIADPYSLTETRFMEGYAETFAENAEDAETANYAEFHALKLALRENGGTVGANNYSPLQTDEHINWYALTPAQIAQLQTIAERNTGRASVMAKGVLCFFHGICYEDDWDNEGVFDTPQPGDDTTGTRAKHIATDNLNDATLTVYPNPTDDVLFIELHGGAGIATVALYDLQGRIVKTAPTARLHDAETAAINVKSIPSGVYVLRVTDADGKEYHQKIVRK